MDITKKVFKKEPTGDGDDHVLRIPMCDMEDDPEIMRILTDSGYAVDHDISSDTYIARPRPGERDQRRSLEGIIQTRKEKRHQQYADASAQQRHALQVQMENETALVRERMRQNVDRNLFSGMAQGIWAAPTTNAALTSDMVAQAAKAMRAQRTAIPPTYIPTTTQETFFPRPGGFTAVEEASTNLIRNSSATVATDWVLPVGEAGENKQTQMKRADEWYGQLEVALDELRDLGAMGYQEKDEGEDR
jgi:hypothetical protein